MNENRWNEFVCLVNCINDREHRRETCATCSGTGCSPGSWDGPRQLICEACGGSGAVEVNE